MRLSRKTIAVAACAGVLTMQFSGLHVHADEHGYVGAAESSYSHGHSHEHHGAGHHDSTGGHGAEAGPSHTSDYDDARDVSLLDLLLGAFKLTLALLLSALMFAVVPRVGMLIGSHFVFPVLSGRFTRWRPPLRAPPLLSTI